MESLYKAFKHQKEIWTKWKRTLAELITMEMIAWLKSKYLGTQMEEWILELLKKKYLLLKATTLKTWVNQNLSWWCTKTKLNQCKIFWVKAELTNQIMEMIMEVTVHSRKKMNPKIKQKLKISFKIHKQAWFAMIKWYLLSNTTSNFCSI